MPGRLHTGRACVWPLPGAQGRYFFGRGIVFFAISAFLLLLLYTGSGTSNFPDMFIILLFPLLILAASCNTGIVLKAAQNKWLQLMGDISYSVYVVHIPLMFTVKIYRMTNAGGEKTASELFRYPAVPYPLAWIYCLLFAAGMIAIAIPVCYFIELPLREGIKKRCIKGYKGPGDNEKTHLREKNTFFEGG